MVGLVFFVGELAIGLDVVLFDFVAPNHQHVVNLVGNSTRALVVVLVRHSILIGWLLQVVDQVDVDIEPKVKSNDVKIQFCSCSIILYCFSPR